MTLNAHNLKRLKELSLRLPKEMVQKKEEPQTKSPRHRIEVETDPSILFHELINASTDGNIPPHLITRLKEAEINNLSSKSPTLNNPKKPGQNNLKRSASPSTEETLYMAFADLLLEEEDNQDSQP